MDRSSNGQESAGATRPSALGWPAEVLRGIAQVDFMPSALCGLFFTAALFAAGWRYGLYGLLGSAVATGTAYALGLDREAVRQGLHGYNGCLVAVGAAVFLGADRPATVLAAVAGSVVSVIVTAALGAVLTAWHLSALTAPFCLVASAMTAGAPAFRRLWHDAPGLAALPVPATGATGATEPSWEQLWHGFFADIGQIFFMPQWYVGLLFLAGLVAADRWAGLMACAGSATALLTAWALGSPADSVGRGLLGYSGVLVAMALSGVFVARSVWSVAYALVGAATATALTPALTALAAPFGGHAFTWPFVLTTLAFLAAVPAVPRLCRV
ncbi:urea transporter [Saccharothrix sp. ST-888]|uniref:urea transporter n=1 Tax=Saccharothrix sp. ST-888 TaxID=1427391 RepID=UPI0009E6012C|nr:urea transporter [Saccharothrix sp. ST-888]